MSRTITGPADLQQLMGVEWQASDQQWAAITAPLAPGVVVAGAGSGKTTLMAARVVYLVATGRVRPEEVLGLTFTTKAAGELRRGIGAALDAAGLLATGPGTPGGAEAPGGRSGDDPTEELEPTVATYNAYAAHLLTEHGLRIGHEPDVRVVTDAARYQLGARVVEQYRGDVERLTDHPPTAVQNLLALDGAMSEHLVDEADVRASDRAHRERFLAERAAEQEGKNRTTYLAEIDKAVSAIDRRAELLGLVGGYRVLKQQLGLMDFSDQIERCARLAQEHPEVGAQERQRFRVVLLDEYQDTSVAQARMLSGLFSGPDPEHGAGHPVTAVGDPQQAIYGWRGASASNLLRFGEFFPDPERPEPRRFSLTVNRRSDRRILDTANALVAPLQSTDVPALEAAPGAGDGSVGVRVFETVEHELDWLAAEVQRCHTTPGATWADIAVLTRDNSHAEQVFDALTAQEVPVEIVGLSGLLRLPEIAEVVATLHLLQDVTDNVSLLTLLSGPRWSLGVRDLRLLARRAAELAGTDVRSVPTTVEEAVTEVVAGVDAAEIAALHDALDDPGDLDYSEEARERFALLSGELRTLRGAVGEPVLDLVRRIIDTSGVDVELDSSASPAAAARRDNLDLFVKAVAEFESIDGQVTLPALLAYLTAEDEQGNGLDVATPTEADSVKLLTVHRAKGLEWPTVFLVGVGESRFPSTRGRSLWTSAPSVLPAGLRGDHADLPALRGHDKPALDAYRQDTKAHDALEERRLGYVAFTRPEHTLWVTSFVWGDRKSPFGPSEFQQVARECLEGWGERVDEWRDKPPKDTPNPRDERDPSVPWPAPGPGPEVVRRREAADRVRAMAAPGGGADEDDAGLDVDEAARVAEWDAEAERLLAEAAERRRPEPVVTLPTSLSATGLARLRDDPEEYARDLRRPMPGPPSRAARSGTRFHQWVQARFGQPDLLGLEDVPGAADADTDDEDELTALIAAFEEGPFADRVPVAVEAPFALVLAGQVVRGRIDAVYAADPGPDGESRFLVVDWKTGRAATADPLQLAVYRLAWAELHGIGLDRVGAAFCYVRTGEVVHPDGLPDRAGLEQLVVPSA